MVRSEATAEDSFAAILARSKFGMAMAAMIRMIATTISKSIREKPRCFFIVFGTRESSSISPRGRRTHEVVHARGHGKNRPYYLLPCSATGSRRRASTRRRGGTPAHGGGQHTTS